MYHLAADGWWRQAAWRRPLRLLQAASRAAAPDRMAEVDLRDAMAGLLRQLPARQRAAIVARYWEQLTEAEAAQAVGCSVGTVKSATSRGLARLRELSESLARRAPRGEGGNTVMTGDIEQLLREGMDRATRGVRMRGGLARQAARQVRQRRLASRTAAAAAVMAGTAAVVAGVAGRPGGGTGPHLQTTAYVMHHVKRALARAAAQNGISYARTRYSGGFYKFPCRRPRWSARARPPPGSPWLIGMETTWQYRNRYREATFSPAGQPVFDCGLRTTRRATVTTAAIYHDRTWWRTPGPGPAHKLTVNFGGHVATAAGIVGRGYRWHPGPSWPVAILRDLATHRYQRVDGVNALKLAGVGATADAPDAIWVDPATYLPVRTVGTLTLIPSRHQPGQSKPGYRWLKPTPANLAQLAVRIPAGFTRVGAP